MASLRVTVPFAQIPEWILDAEETGLSDREVRLYGLLCRYGNGPEAVRVPSRTTLARRLRCSEDSIDRAKVELVTAGALIIQKRSGLTNSYLLETGGRTGAGGTSRIGAAPPAARVRPNREQPTESREEPKGSSRQPDVLWDKLAQIIGAEPTTKTERGRWNKALKEMREAQVTPEQLATVALAYRKTWPEMTLTPTALVANWTVLTANGTSVKDLKIAELRARIAEKEGTT